MTDFSRREFVRILLAGAAAASFPSLGLLQACRKKKCPPNILIFLADDLGYGDLGCYGNPINRTPHVDRFAAEGIRFTDFHAAGTVCSPSRASLLTGRHPYRVGFYYILDGGAHLRREEVTIASLLRQSGYATCFVGKWHLTDFDSPEKGQPDPGDHGFDHWFATVLNAFEGPENPEKFYRNGQPTGPLQGWYCDLIVEEAIGWLKEQKGKESLFFCWSAPMNPIPPLNPLTALPEGSTQRKWTGWRMASPTGASPAQRQRT